MDTFLALLIGIIIGMITVAVVFFFAIRNLDNHPDLRVCDGCEAYGCDKCFVDGRCPYCGNSARKSFDNGGE